MTIETYTLQRGHSPLLISFPHVGTAIPVDQQYRYTPRALQAEDTDWFLDRLYAFAAGLGATLIVPRFSRYLVDLNRSSDNAPMYPGQNNTELCPTRHFSGEVLYREQLAPDATEIARRVTHYWQPYHDALRTELDRLRTLHGSVVLWDTHSIASVMPRFFDGKLPDLNLGTADGRACAPALQAVAEAAMNAQTSYTHVSNGRFKGGYITRHYGRPEQGIHALQLEMCQCTYMDETAPFGYRPDRAAQILPLLQRMLDAVVNARTQRA